MGDRNASEVQLIEDFSGVLSSWGDEMLAALASKRSQERVPPSSDGKLCPPLATKRLQFGGRECATVPEREQRIAHLRDLARYVNREPMAVSIHGIIVVHPASEYKIVTEHTEAKITLADWNPVDARVEVTNRLGFARRLATTVERLAAAGLALPSLAPSSVSINFVQGEFTPTLTGWEDAFIPHHPVPPPTADPWWAAPEIVFDPERGEVSEAAMVFSLALHLAQILAGAVQFKGPKVGAMPAERICAGASLIDVLKASPDLRALLPRGGKALAPFSRELSSILAQGCAEDPAERPTLLELRRALFPTGKSEKPQIRYFQIRTNRSTGLQRIRWHVEGADDVSISGIGPVGFRGEAPTEDILEFELLGRGPGGEIKARIDRGGKKKREPSA